MQTLIKTLMLVLILGGILPLQAQFISSKDEKNKETLSISREKDLVDYQQIYTNLKNEYRLNQKDHVDGYLKQLTEIMQREIDRSLYELTQHPGEKQSERRLKFENRITEEKRIHAAVLSFDPVSQTSPKALIYLQTLLDQFEELMKATLTEAEKTTSSEIIQTSDGSTVIDAGDAYMAASTTVVKGQRNDKAKKTIHSKPVLSRKEVADEIASITNLLINAYNNNDPETGSKLHNELIDEMEKIIEVNQKQLVGMRKDGKNSTDKEFKILSYKTQTMVGVKKKCQRLSLPKELTELKQQVATFNHYIR